MDMNHSPDQDRVMAKPHKPQRSVRPGAEWDRTPSPRVHSNTTPSSALEDGRVSRSCPAESSFGQMDFQQQVCMDRDLQEEQQNPLEPGTESEPTLSPSPAHSLEADLELPLETDIDDFQEDELPAEDTPLTSELPCFAQPVTVLETDIDLVPDPEASLSGERPAESSSVEELEAEESCRERLSLEEMLSEGESGTESWTGALQPVERSTDSLDRYTAELTVFDLPSPNPPSSLCLITV